MESCIVHGMPAFSIIEKINYLTGDLAGNAAPDIASLQHRHSTVVEWTYHTRDKKTKNDSRRIT